MQTAASIKEDLKNRIIKGITYGIQGLEEVLPNSSSVYNDFVLLASQYNELTHFSTIKGTISYDQFEVGTNKIRNGLLQLIDRIEDHDLQEHELKSELENKALPNRRENFFRLLDLHYKITADFKTIVYHYDKEDSKKEGKAVIYMIWQGVLFNNKKHWDELAENPDLPITVEETFVRWVSELNFSLLVSLFNNIKHILNYIHSDEVDKEFFLSTLKSILTNYELDLLLLYAEADPKAELDDLLRLSFTKKDFTNWKNTLPEAILDRFFEKK